MGAGGGTPVSQKPILISLVKKKKTSGPASDSSRELVGIQEVETSFFSM